MTLAENVFKFRNLPNYLDVSYINKVLVKQGSIAFFEDEVLGLLALPYIPIGKLDVYGRPLKIQVTGQNGYINTLTADKFVLMYDNNGRYFLSCNYTYNPQNGAGSTMLDREHSGNVNAMFINNGDGTFYYEFGRAGSANESEFKSKTCWGKSESLKLNCD